MQCAHEYLPTPKGGWWAKRPHIWKDSSNQANGTFIHDKPIKGLSQQQPWLQLGMLLTPKQQVAVAKDDTASIKTLLAKVMQLDDVLCVGRRCGCSRGCTFTLKFPSPDQCMVYDSTEVAANHVGDLYAQWVDAVQGKNSRGVKKYGYLQVKLASGVWEYAHRLVMWALEGPPSPLYNQVMHTCDNKMCLNPIHLMWGNEVENMGKSYGRAKKARRKLLQQGPTELRLQLVKPLKKRKKR